MTQPNFTLPNSAPGENDQAKPMGTGDNGATWDPVQKRWIARADMPAESAQGAEGSGQLGANGYRAPDQAGFANTNFGDHQSLGHDKSQGAFGGYDGTWEEGPDGQAHLNYGKSGEAAYMDRYRTASAAAQGRGAVQNDYRAADLFADQGNQSRDAQRDALNISRATALNGDQVSQALGQRMLTQGGQAQQAAALSSRGGALAGMSALQRTNAGNAGYMQRGNNALAAQRADDMTAGRNEYMGIASTMRAGDQTAQGLNQRQGIEQGKNQIEQNTANDKLEGGYEDLAQGVLTQQQQADLKREQTQAGIYGNQLQSDQTASNRSTRAISDALSGTTSAVNSLSDSRSKTKACIADFYGKR